ncbi:peptidoglycan DD-metalloendopeptidase family protein [Halomonas sp. NO4]|uniref:peptidoglycan DD-metalloendopeptidase family protein n=1 Tax=Halomonas sp. NO4 TaxID=2484813 RepID=UPI0013D7DFA1|nr:peptidoglycan DD-metalloendopeptidase family protein [Halomonas sp. NO4]
MRKLFLVSAIALAMTGCAAQQESAPPQVRDLSTSRERAAETHYTVEAGDTLYGIAWRHGMDYRDLAQLNQIGPPYRIQPGQQLRLQPGGQAASGNEGTPQVQDGAVATATALGGTQADSGDDDWLLPDEEAIARNRRLTAEDDDATAAASDNEADAETTVAAAEDAGTQEAPQASTQQASAQQESAQQESTQQASAQQQSAQEGAQEPSSPEAEPEPDAGTEVAGAPERSSGAASRTYTPVEEVPWQWPVDGEVIGSYGEGESITAGIDIAGQKGQPVTAAGPGIVVYAGSGVRGYGNLVLIKHNDQFLSAYAHNESLQVSENDVVEAGEVIATMGDSDAESVRLHFEVRKDGQPQDPLEYLPSR